MRSAGVLVVLALFTPACGEANPPAASSAPASGTPGATATASPAAAPAPPVSQPTTVPPAADSAATAGAGVANGAGAPAGSGAAAETAEAPIVAASSTATGSATAGPGTSVSTKAVEIRVEAVTTVARVGTRQPRPGHEFVIVETSWKNLIPLTPVDKNASSSPVGGLSGFGTSKRPPPDPKDIEMKPTPYVVPMLRKQFWLFTDERYADTVDLDAQAATDGAFPANGFGVAKLGDVVRGKLVFEVPTGSRYRVFQFYDNNHGHASFVLGGARPSAAPSIGSARQDDTMQLALAEARFSETPGPGPGLKYFHVALRGRSLSPANIIEIRPFQFVFLQTDRGCVSMAERGAPGLARPMGDTAPFPPTSPNEEQLAFAVPDDTKDVRVLISPAGRPAMALPSKEGFAVTWPAPQQSIQDGATLKMHVLPTPATPARLPAAPAGRELVMLDVVAENLKPTQGIEFQGTMQLRLKDASGGYIQPSPLSSQLTCTLGDTGVIPAGHARRFRYVYDVPAGMPLTLEYRGFEKDAVVVEIRR